MDDIIIIPNFTIHPDRINFHNEYIFPNGQHGRRNYNIAGLNNNSNRNRISSQAHKKITRAVSYIDLVSKKQKVYVPDIKKRIDFKLTFVTLTLPSRQIHSDQIIRRDCMHHFITIAERKWNIKHYIIRSERQANGNLHFHFICSSFIPHQELRDTWNNIINKLGYVDRYREEMKTFHK